MSSEETLSVTPFLIRLHRCRGVVKIIEDKNPPLAQRVKPAAGS
jgi:hypothetical protein